MLFERLAGEINQLDRSLLVLTNLDALYMNVLASEMCTEFTWTPRSPSKSGRRGACWAFLRPPHRCQPRRMALASGRVDPPGGKDLDCFYLASAADYTIPTRYTIPARYA